MVAQQRNLQTDGNVQYTFVYSSFCNTNPTTRRKHPLYGFQSKEGKLEGLEQGKESQQCYWELHTANCACGSSLSFYYGYCEW